MQSLAAKYDKTLARLAEDRKAVASEAAERDAEERAVQRSREQAVAAQAAAQEEQAQFDEQVKHPFICLQTYVCRHWENPRCSYRRHKLTGSVTVMPCNEHAQQQAEAGGSRTRQGWLHSLGAWGQVRPGFGMLQLPMLLSQ